MQIKIILGLFIISVFFGSCKKKDITIEPDSPVVWVVGDRVVMKSTNGGSIWTDCLSGDNFIINLGVMPMSTNQVYRNISFNNTLSGAICGDNGFFAITKNAQLWKGGYMDPPIQFYSASKIDTGTYYFSGEDNFFFGNLINWGISHGDITNTVFYSMDFISSNEGWIAGDNSIVIYLSNISEKKWTLQTTAPENIYKAVRIHLLSSGQREVWLAGDKGVVFKTIDKGLSWKQIPTGTTENLTSICFTDDQTCYITGSNGLILKTSDNGSTFQKLNTNVSENLNSVSFMNKKKGIAVGNFGTYIVTNDEGISWVYEHWDKNKNLYCVLFAKRFYQK